MNTHAQSAKENHVLTLTRLCRLSSGWGELSWEKSLAAALPFIRLAIPENHVILSALLLNFQRLFDS